MANPALKTVSKQTAKALLAQERKRRKSGEWGKWSRVESPHCLRDDWLGEVNHVRKNRVFSVLVRPAGGAVHLAVSSLSGIRPTWHEMQRIKDELAGPDATAVEVYPPQSEIVDGADMFHIWLVGPLPFSLADDRHLRAALKGGE